MPTAESDNAKLIQNLNTELTTFDDNLHPLPTYQRLRFESLLRCFQEDVGNKTAQSRSRYLRARNILRDIMQGVDIDLLILTTLSTNMTVLGSISQRGLISDLRNWWYGVTHPKGLSLLSAQLVKDYSIDTLLKTSTKRERDILEVSEAGRPKRSHLAPSSEPETVLGAQGTIPPYRADRQETNDPVLQSHNSASLSGKVYKLTARDVSSDMAAQLVGDVLLTIPFDRTFLPFITVSIPHKLSMKFVAEQRPRMM